MSGCSKLDCAAEGEFYAVVCLPAKGASKKHPLRMLINLPLCEVHCEQLVADDFLGPDMRASLRVQLMQQGKQQPDFRRVWKERGRVGDQHWLAFQAALRAKR